MLKQKEVTKEDSIKKATIKTNVGDITIALFPEEAPKAVENFVTLAKKGYYNGVVFHRVIPNFMIQSGDPTGTGAGGESIYGQSFEDEISTKLFNFYGALSMANAGPNTNGSQFFIVGAKTVDPTMLKQLAANGWPEESVSHYKEVGGTPWLDGKHTVFGQVINGADVVDTIEETKTDFRDKPIKDIVIDTIDIDA